MKIKFFAFFFILMIVFNNNISAKIRLLTFHYNKPEFITLQHKMFKKFMLDSYELIVFNDAKDPLLATIIENKCKKHGIQCIRYEQEWHLVEPLNYQIAEWLQDFRITNIHKFISSDPSDIAQQPSVRHCHVIKYALENFGYNHNDIIALVDGDAFPIKPLSIRSLLYDYDIIGLHKGYAGIDYLWVVFVAFDAQTLPNINELTFDIAVINDIIHDTGSYTYHYLNNNPNVKFKKYIGQVGSDLALKPTETLLEEGFTHAEIQLIKKNDWPPVEFHLDKCLFHFSTSSFNFPGYEQKEINLKKFIGKVLKE